jgi:hypothetical protein
VPTNWNDTSHLEIEGLNRLKSALRKAQLAIDDEIKEANAEAAKIVETAARPLVPVRTGRLAASLRSSGNKSGGYVRAGNNTKVRYAGPIHFGWPTRGLHSDEDAFTRAVTAGKFQKKTIRKIAERAAAVRDGRANKIRGGPIRPQPFIYEAMDRRIDDVLGAYERRIEAIFERVARDASTGPDV